jgi:hypothetical protein
MATTYELIDSVTLGSAAASIAFDSIPQTYDDLAFHYSARSTGSGAWVTGYFFFNAGQGDNPTRSARNLYGTGSAVGSDGNANIVMATGASATSNTFANGEIYIPNYTGSTSKSASGSAVTENNATTAIIWQSAYLGSSTSAITKIYTEMTSGNYAAGSSFYLYGVTHA